ncbi:hypothetical protein CBE89_11000 [Corynebacterium striatum]|uniref:ABC transporter permease n=1 Tax=Corynebacterium striatum TaxID=43770 RepID=A0A2Z2J9N2_CORST|nr:hypothetical protein CBE89_11000 [Corynebacterium striatum]TXS62745.1 hypothetical protein CHU71_10490 [Corynebacterium sp. LK14]
MSFLRSSLLAVGIFATAILATTVAFLGARLYSTIDGHLGEYGVQVESDRIASERVSFYSELAEFARNNDFDIAINYSSLAVSGGEQRVYSSSLPPDGGRMERPRFERGEVDIFYPLEDFPYSDPRQPLHIKGSAADEQHLLRWLDEQGLDAVPLTRYFTEIFASSTIPILLILSVLLCLVLSAGHVLARSREAGVHRLLGLSVAETTSIEIKRQSITLVLAYLGAPLLVAGLLYAYNGWAEGWVFWRIYFTISLILSACLLIGYLGGQFLVRRTSIPQSVKGKIHARPILYSLTVVRGVSLVAALSVVATLVGFSAELEARHRLQGAWDAHRGQQELALNVNTAFEDWSDREAAAPFRAADEAGDILLVDPYWITWPVELEAPVLLVNQEFARQAGASMLDGTVVTVCSPGKLSLQSTNVIEDTLKFEASYTNEPAPDIEWRDGCSLGSVFTYDVDYRPQVDNPILVILPRGLAPLGDHNLMSKVSQQVLLTASPDVPSQMLKGATGNTLAFFRPREDSWQSSIRAAEQNVALWGLNGFAVVLLVTVLVGATVLTFRVTYRRKIHVAYVCGRSPWWVAKEAVAFEVVFFVATIGWLLYMVRDHQVQAESRAPSTWSIGFENQWSPLTIVAVVGFSAVWFLVSMVLMLRAASQWDARGGVEPQ